MAKQPWGGRPSKAALMRIKLATVVVSAVTFASSLGMVAHLNPGVHNTAGLTSQVQPASTLASANSAASQGGNTPLQLRQGQQGSLAPLVRTRGS